MGEKKRKEINSDESNSKDGRVWRKELRKTIKQIQEKQLKTIGLALIPQCLLCGRRHGDASYTVDKKTCYKCGELGHISRNCSNPPKRARTTNL